MMLTIAIVMTVAFHLACTGGSLYLWNATKKRNPAKLPQVFYILTGCRMVSMVICFLFGILMLRGDVESIKVFSIVSLAAYILLLVFDTAYFYCSSQLLNNNKQVKQ